MEESKFDKPMLKTDIIDESTIKRERVTFISYQEKYPKINGFTFYSNFIKDSEYHIKALNCIKDNNIEFVQNDVQYYNYPIPMVSIHVKNEDYAKFLEKFLDIN